MPSYVNSSDVSNARATARLISRVLTRIDSQVGNDDGEVSTREISKYNGSSEYGPATIPSKFVSFLKNKTGSTYFTTGSGGDVNRGLQVFVKAVADAYNNGATFNSLAPSWKALIGFGNDWGDSSASELVTSGS